MERFKRILAGLAAAVLGFLALELGDSGFQHVLDFRVLERIPLTSILGATGGELSLIHI